LLNVTLARISPFITWLKWPSAIVCTCFLVYSRRYGIAVLALVWPLAGVIVSLLGTAFSARLGVGTTGKIERALAARIGYPGASAQDGPLPHDLSESGHFGKPLSVVLVDDEEFLLDCLEVIIRSWFNNARLLRFKNGLEAWEELSRTEPDLLITDDNMPVLNGEGLCLRLLEKKVAYPIIVQSASAPTQEWVETCASRGLNVAFLAEPYDVESLRRKFLEAGLRVPN
jgi:CheY-like chemotaxis protein